MTAEILRGSTTIARPVAMVRSEVVVVSDVDSEAATSDEPGSLNEPFEPDVSPRPTEIPTPPLTDDDGGK
jgi:hypothetical protein